MDNLKEQSLKLANELEGYYWENEDEELTPSKLIRRLVEELDKQGEPVAWIARKFSGFSDYLIADKLCRTLEEVEDFKRSIGGTIQVEPLISTTPQTKPLSDEEILEYSDVFSLDKSPLYEFTDKGLVLFVRAIEAKVRGQ